MQKTSWNNIKSILEELEKRKIEKLNYTSLLVFVESFILISDLTAKRYINIMERHNLIKRDGINFILVKQITKSD